MSIEWADFLSRVDDMHKGKGPDYLDKAVTPFLTDDEKVSGILLADLFPKERVDMPKYAAALCSGETSKQMSIEDMDQAVRTSGVDAVARQVAVALEVSRRSRVDNLCLAMELGELGAQYKSYTKGLEYMRTTLVTGK